MPIEGVKGLGQRQTAKVLEDGLVHDVVEVSFTVDGFGPFTETIRLSDYTPEVIQARVSDVARKVRGTAAIFASD